MPEQRLSPLQRFVSRLLRTASSFTVYDLTWRFRVTTGSVAAPAVSSVTDMEPFSPAAVGEVGWTEWSGRVTDVVAELTAVHLGGATLVSLTTRVVDGELGKMAVPVIRGAELCDLPPVHDLDDWQQDALRVDYRTRTHNLPFHDFSFSCHNLVSALTPVLHDGVASLGQLAVRRQSIPLNFLSKGEQLSFWRQAIQQTGREARQLQLVGVFPGIPIGAAERFGVDWKTERLIYRFIPGRTGVQVLRDIAVFQDTVEKKAVLVVR